MTLDEYQVTTRRTRVGTKNFPFETCNLIMGLTGEAGEVADYMKKVLFQGHDFDPSRLEKELGDLAWYLAALADHYGISLEHVAQENINKLASRYPNGFSAELSRERPPEDGAPTVCAICAGTGSVNTGRSGFTRCDICKGVGQCLI